MRSFHCILMPFFCREIWPYASRPKLIGYFTLLVQDCIRCVFWQITTWDTYPVNIDVKYGYGQHVPSQYIVWGCAHREVPQHLAFVLFYMVKIHRKDGFWA